MLNSSVRCGKEDVINHYWVGGYRDYATSFDAYGNSLNGGGMITPFGYGGAYKDSESGLMYLNARYYDAGTGRFTQEDIPHGDNCDHNLYAYCGNDPVNRTDPSGHCYGQPSEWHYGVDEYKLVTKNELAKYKTAVDYNVREGRVVDFDKNGNPSLYMMEIVKCSKAAEHKKAYESTFLNGYINKQNKDTVVYLNGQYKKMQDIRMAFGNVFDNGCGIIAAYNVLHSYSSKITFSSVFNSFNNPLAFTLGVGVAGIDPVYLTGYMSMHFWLTLPAGPDTYLWGIQAELSGAVIVLVRWEGSLRMHYFAGISTGNGGVGGSFKFYNTGLKDEKGDFIDGRTMSIWDLLDVMKNGHEDTRAQPIMLIGVAGKKGWW